MSTEIDYQVKPRWVTWFVDKLEELGISSAWWDTSGHVMSIDGNKITLGVCDDGVTISIDVNAQGMSFADMKSFWHIQQQIMDVIQCWSKENSKPLTEHGLVQS